MLWTGLKIDRLLFSPPRQATGKFRINEEDIFTAIQGLMKQAKGGYTCVAMLAGFGIIAFRDPNGIRPLGLCSRNSPDAGSATASSSGTSSPAVGHGKDYCFTSESVVGDALGFDEFEDVKPGEAIIITRHQVSRRVLVDQSAYEFAPDIFEYVYFARPDSVMDGISVYRSRIAMGDRLAVTVRKTLRARMETIDVVIPVPDTSRVAALQVAQSLGVPYREGFVKNRYVGRTFIMPGQSVRRKNVRRKLNAMAMEFKGRNVLLVDDSIVRGTTSREIIQMAREAGAKKVVMASCAPAIRYSNVYGIDMPSRHELVAHGRTEEEVASHIHADLVIYQTLPDLVESVQECMTTVQIKRFDTAVFDGDYVTGGVDEAYLSSLESLRSDNAKLKTAASRISQPAGAAPTSGSGGTALVVGPPGEGAGDGKMAAPPAMQASYVTTSGRENTNGNGLILPGGGERGGKDDEEDDGAPTTCQGPMNGADDLALHNGWSR